MKVLKALRLIFIIVALVFNIAALVLIPISQFEEKGRLIIGLIGNTSLLIGIILGLFINILRRKTDKQITPIKKDTIEKININ